MYVNPVQFGNEGISNKLKLVGFGQLNFDIGNYHTHNLYFGIHCVNVDQIVCEINVLDEMLLNTSLFVYCMQLEHRPIFIYCFDKQVKYSQSPRNSIYHRTVQSVVVRVDLLGLSLL